MKIVLFSIFILSVAVLSEVSGRSCAACGLGPGSDYCACNPNPYLVRPIPVKPLKGKSFKPIGGDVCVCKNVDVKPVLIPRPKYVFREKKPVQYDNSPLILAPDHLHDFSQDIDTLDTTLYDLSSPCNPKPLYPVDAVSISLVNRMQESFGTSLPEERLQYGFYKIPKDVPNFRTVVNIPEEKLHTVERQIVELKHPKQIVTFNVGSEDIVLEDEEPQPVVNLSYSDLGYVPVEGSNPTFITSCQKKGRVHKVPIYEDSCEERCVVKKVKTSCDC